MQWNHLKYLKQKLKKAISSCIVVIGVMAVFGAVMAGTYEATSKPGALRAAWEKFRANPQAIAQNAIADVVSFVASDTEEAPAPPAVTAKPEQPPAVQPPAPKQKEPAPMSPARRAQPAPAKQPAKQPVTAVAPAEKPTDGPIFLRDLYPLGIRLINEDRQRHGADGIRPLEPHPVLMELAEKKAADLLAYGYFDHYSPRLGHPVEMINARFSPDPAWAGENLTRDASFFSMGDFLRNVNPRNGQGRFMASEMHRRAILAFNATHVGYAYIAGEVRVAKDEDLKTEMGRYVGIIVQLFMKEARTDLHSIRLELVGTPTIIPDQPTTVTVRAHAEYQGRTPQFIRDVSLISMDPGQQNLNAKDRQFGEVQAGETFTVTLQALPPGVQTATHFIVISSLELSPEHAERKDAQMKFDIRDGRVFIYGVWRDASGKEHHDIFQ